MVSPAASRRPLISLKNIGGIFWRFLLRLLDDRLFPSKISEGESPYRSGRHVLRRKFLPLISLSNSLSLIFAAPREKEFDQYPAILTSRFLNTHIFVKYTWELWEGTATGRLEGFMIKSGKDKSFWS